LPRAGWLGGEDYPAGVASGSSVTGGGVRSSCGSFLLAVGQIRLDTPDNVVSGCF
jgi:hypothetical protein